MNFLAFRNEICYNEPVLLQPFCIEDEVQKMAVSYKKLFKILIDRDMKKKDLAEQANLSNYTINKMHRGENVTTDSEIWGRVSTKISRQTADKK